MDRRGKVQAVPQRTLRPDDVAVSDVLGSILLVGITVLMAAGFGAVLLAYDGPSDRQHTQLSIAVGPGADGDWGVDDAELKVLHVGGEPLRQQDVRINYVDAAGFHSVTPTFSGGTLSLGGTWVQVVSASPGDPVEATVIVKAGRSEEVLQSGTVSAGTGAALTYVTSLTPASGKGTVTDFANATSAIDSSAAATLSEGAVGGTPLNSQRSPASASQSGSSGQDNILGSDDLRSLQDGSGDWVQGAGFSAPAGAVAVSALSIGFEGRGASAASTIAHAGTTLTGTTNGGSTVTTATLLGDAGDVYLAAVANGESTLRTVTGITGPPGITWSLVGQAGNSAGNGRLEVWVGTGTPSLTGIVTATFSGTVDRGAISVSRYSGVDTSNPIQASLAGEAAGAGSDTLSLGAVAGTATTGRFYAAINGVGTGTFTFTTPASERADVDPGGNRVQLGVADGVAAASNTVAGTITASADWHGVALTLRPLSASLPLVELTYRLSGATGATSLTQTLTSSDDSYAVSIIGDRSWSVGDIAGLDVRVTYPTDMGSDVEVDHVFLSLTYTTAPTTYVTQADFAFGGVPDLPAQTFQLRYHVSGDTFLVYAMTGAAERLCPGVLDSATFAIFQCTLTAGEHNSGAPVLRIKDVNPAGSTQGIVTIDYARVATS